MIAEYRKKSNIGIGGGIVAGVAGRVLMAVSSGSADAPPSTALIVLGAIIAIAGAVLYFWGCVQYCLGKGQSGWLGIVGILGLIGLIIMIFLPDKTKGGGPPAGSPNYGAPQPGVWPPPPTA